MSVAGVGEQSAVIAAIVDGDRCRTVVSVTLTPE